MGFTLNGNKTDITEEFIKIDEDNMTAMFGDDFKIESVTNFSKTLKTAFQSIDFILDFAQVTMRFNEEKEEIGYAIDEAKEAKHGVIKLRAEREEAENKYSEEETAYNKKCKEYLPFTSAELAIEDEEAQSTKWLKRFNAQLEKDRKKILPMIVTKESYEIIKSGLEKSEQAVKDEKIPSAFTYSHMLSCVQLATMRTAQNKREADLKKGK